MQPSSNRRNGFAREPVSVSSWPAPISYLLFGGVPGFVVFRYVLALIRDRADLHPAPTPVQPRRGGDWGHRDSQLPVIILAWGIRFSGLGSGVVPDRRTRMPSRCRRRTTASAG